MDRNAKFAPIVWEVVSNPLMRVGTVVLLFLLLGDPAIAQLKTIPQQLAEQGTDLMSGATVPSGASPDLDVVLRDSEMIVRGVVGNPRSYLSDDQTTICSDYPILEPVILFDTMIASSSKPGPPEIEIVVTLEGGKLTLGGLTFTVTPGGLPGLEPGSECLLLLKRLRGKLYVAGDGYLGAFGISPDEKLTPLTGARDFAPAYRGVAATAAVNNIVARRQSIAR